MYWVSRTSQDETRSSGTLPGGDSRRSVTGAYSGEDYCSNNTAELVWPPSTCSSTCSCTVFTFTYCFPFFTGQWNFPAAALSRRSCHVFYKSRDKLQKGGSIYYRRSVHTHALGNSLVPARVYYTRSILLMCDKTSNLAAQWTHNSLHVKKRRRAWKLYTTMQPCTIEVCVRYSIL